MLCAECQLVTCESSFHVMQPIVHWLRLPSGLWDSAESAGGKGEAAGQGGPSFGEPNLENHAESRMAGGRRSTSSLAVAAGFARTAKGLSCCIAVAKRDSQHHEKSFPHTLIQPVWPRAAAAGAVWQVTVLPFARQEGEYHAPAGLRSIFGVLTRPAWWLRNWCDQRMH